METINPIYNFLQLEIEGVDSLAELALDVHWSWNHSTDEVWKQLDPDLWDLTHNPWVVLQTTSRDKLEKVLSDEAFRKKLDFLLDAKNKATDKEMAWFPRNHRQCPLRCVAYFSMEFMLSEALPIYSGGLGNVAGDQLKACSDLGIPVIGVVDTNHSPDGITHVIPGNDDSSRAIRLYARGVADSILEGRNQVVQEIISEGSDEFVEVNESAGEEE